jgi:ketosteroid isomerase-like protein
MSELAEFYQRYIAAFNACDHEAFAAFFHPPVTVLHATRYDERRAGRALAVLEDLSTMATRPVRWSHTTVDSVIELTDTGPSLAALTTLGSGDRPEPRPGLVTIVTRWDQAGAAYQRIQAHYLLTREQGQLGIKVLVELDVADLT